MKKIEKHSVHIAQVLMYPLLWLMRIYVVRDRLHYNIEHLKLGKKGKDARYVIYANHQSKLDPLIICASLPIRTLKRLMPFRFFVYNPYLKGVSGNLTKAMGGFPAHYEEKKAYGLDKAIDCLNQNQTVVIFPSGMRTREKIVKRGVAVLAAQPNTYLIPIHIEWKHKWHCRVHIGEPIKGQTDHLPEQLMEYVYDLPKKTVKA